MKLKKIKTDRGFRRLEFTDGYGAPCILQKSSAAMKDFIWLGMLAWPAMDKVTGGQPSATMHLDRKAVKKLLPILQHFADTGELP
jgi:hypothetical protein